MQKVNYQMSEDEYAACMIQFAAFHDSVCTFEKHLIALPSCMSRDPDNLQVHMLDVKKLS